MMDIDAYWAAVLRQDADAIRACFLPDAYVNWHNTNEHFTVEEFIRANCEYPDAWNGEIERIAAAEDCTSSTARLTPKQKPALLATRTLIWKASPLPLPSVPLSVRYFFR